MIASFVQNRMKKSGEIQYHGTINLRLASSFTIRLGSFLDSFYIFRSNVTERQILKESLDE